MKKSITTAFLFLYAITLKADHDHSDLILKMHNPGLFTVILDHRHYHPNHEFSIKNITPGRHYLTVYRTGRSSAIPAYSGFIDIPSASVVTALIKARNLHIIESYPKINCHYPSPAVGMNEYEFQDLKGIISNKTFDSSRLAIAKQAVRTNALTSRQLVEIIRLLSFDSSRLEFAKYSYDYVVDPAAFYLIYDSFTFDSSVDELIDYLAVHS